MSTINRNGEFFNRIATPTADLSSRERSAQADAMFQQRRDLDGCIARLNEVESTLAVRHRAQSTFVGRLVWLVTGR